MRVRGRVAVVTGASSGIGEATALALARAGATVVVTGRRKGELEASAAACRGHAPDSFAVTADVSSRGECETVVSEARRRLGQVDIVINNAGISLRKLASDTSVEEIEEVMAVNFLGAVYTTMAALPGMIERRLGSVVNITSVAGYLPNPKESAYGASKAALSLWSHGLAVDLAGTGVHVGALSPGPIDTGIWEKDEVPANYEGKKFPPEVVADAAVKMVEKEIIHMTVPRRFGAPSILYALPLLGRAVRRGLIRYDRRPE